GGAALDRVLSALRAHALPARTGASLVVALENAQIGGSGPVGGPACAFFAGSDYLRAVCWIGACLADALHYAHERGLVHLDLKPSNVLLAADGQPMLLDFHLARAPLKSNEPAPPWLGGTPAYMAPEQKAALEAVRSGGKISTGIDGRADIYS